MLAMEPEVILLDEPCSGLDPISTAKIEEALRELKKDYTIILVTNNTKQAARVADRTAFFLMGEMVEIGPTAKIFTAPDDKRTDDYVRAGSDERPWTNIEIRDLDLFYGKFQALKDIAWTSNSTGSPP